MSVVAGVGCRRGCPADGVVAAVRMAEATAGRVATVLAAPWFKRGEAGVAGAAGLLGLPVVWVGEAEMRAVQGACPTRSSAVEAATGLASVAEAAALAASGGRLVLPRVARGAATCALAEGAA